MRNRHDRIAMFASMVASVSIASADAVPAAPTDGAPLPGEESGRIDRGGESEGPQRQLRRAVLFVPRILVAVVVAPLRAGVWVYDKYQVKERYMDLAFNDARTFGVYPIAGIESGYGLSGGARIVHRNLFGEGERVRLRAVTGGRFRHDVALDLGSGQRFGSAFAVGAEGELERRPNDRFFGIGNSDPGVLTRFRQQVARVSAGANLRIAPTLQLRPAGTLARFELSRSDEGPPIDEVYPEATMVGFDGASYGYGELELRWDTRGRASRWESPSVPARGWLVSGFAGRAASFGAGEDFWRYGTDLQHFLRIGKGPRVLAARLYGEVTDGSVDQIPFTQLPSLGGSTLLRGYTSDRFRDRVAAVGSIEYRWDLSYELTASMFVDAGRVYSGLDNLTLDDMRVGFGVGFELYNSNAFLMRGSLASSRDGGVFLDLSFDPGRDVEPRVERR
jgi:outer membrane protein assembly factor BamA